VVLRTVPNYPHLAAYKSIAIQAAMIGGMHVVDSKGGSRLITKWSQLRKVMKLQAYKYARLAPTPLADPDFHDAEDTQAILDMVPKDPRAHKQVSHPRSKAANSFLSHSYIHTLIHTLHVRCSPPKFALNAPLRLT
jgi:hypothetical protein